MDTNQKNKEKLIDSTSSILSMVPRRRDIIQRHPVDLISVLLENDDFLVYGRTDLGGELLYYLKSDTGEVTECKIRGETPFDYFDQGLVLQTGAGGDTFHIISSNGLYWTLCQTLGGSFLFVKKQNLSINMTIPRNLKIGLAAYYEPSNEEVVIARQWIRGVLHENYGFAEFMEDVEHPIAEINHIFSSLDGRIFCTGAGCGNLAYIVNSSYSRHTMYTMNYNVFSLMTDDNDPFGTTWWSKHEKRDTFLWGRIAVILGFSDADIGLAVDYFVRGITQTMDGRKLLFSNVPMLVLKMICRYVGGEIVHYWPINKGYLMSSASYLKALQDIRF